jgi:hypothetical protein
MKQFTSRSCGAFALVLCFTQHASAQIARTRTPAGDAQPIAGAMARDPQFPYAGLWQGTRTMPRGTGEIAFRFSVTDGAYAGATVHADGGTVPHRQLTATAAGLEWEQPNSGGGTWVYRVRLVGPDSMIGTLVLRDPPPNLTPAPSGTMVLVRQPVPTRRER